MGFFDPLINILINISSFVGNFISSIIKTVAEPILKMFMNIFGGVFWPILTSYSSTIVNNIVQTFKIIIPATVNSILYKLSPSKFTKENSGWNWFCNILLDIGFIAGYFVFLYGYAYLLRFGGNLIDLEFLPISILLTLLVIPFVPIIHFIYTCVIMIKLTRDIISIIDQTILALNTTQQFFIKNVISILIKYAFLFSYQIFLFIYDIFITLPPIATQLFKIGTIGNIIMNIIIYYPVWWFLYSFFIEKSNENDIPTRILNAMDSIINTVKSALNWVFEKVYGIIEVFKSD